jgi:hypothetical protein
MKTRFSWSKKKEANNKEVSSNILNSRLFSIILRGQDIVRGYVQTTEIKKLPAKKALPSHAVLQIWRDKYCPKQKLKELIAIRSVSQETLKVVQTEPGTSGSGL